MKLFSCKVDGGSFWDDMNEWFWDDLFPLVALPVFMFSLPCYAQDLTTRTGIALTSDDDIDEAIRPALQGYLEIEHPSGLYGGIWATTLAPDPDADSDSPPDRVEFDLYAGYRGEVGAFSYDLSYYRYVYDRSHDCCGEVFFEVDYALNDRFTLGTELSSDFKGGDSVTPVVTLALPGEFELSAEYSFNRGTADRDWRATLSHPIGDHTTLALDYWDSTTQEPRAAVTITFDTEILKRRR